MQGESANQEFYVLIKEIAKGNVHQDIENKARKLAGEKDVLIEMLNHALKVGQEKSLSNLFYNNLRLIASGMLCLAEKTTLLAKKFGFPPELVTYSLLIGSKMLFDQYTNYIKQGICITLFEKYARELIKNYGRGILELYNESPITELENALKIGIGREYYRILGKISKGRIYLKEKARRMAKKYGLPLSDLEKAIIVGSNQAQS